MKLGKRKDQLNEMVALGREMKSVEVYREGKKEGEGYPRRHPMTRDGQFISIMRSDMRTLYEVIVAASELYRMIRQMHELISRFASVSWTTENQ